MNIIITGLLISFSLFLILYVFSNFTYEVSENSIYIRWKLLKYIPFNSRKIKIDDILEVRRFEYSKDIIVGAHVWGNLFIKEGIIIVLKKGLIRNVYITPENPSVFIEQFRDLNLRKN